MRQPLVAGNWKMNGTRAGAAALIETILGDIERVGGAEVIVCPPFVLLETAADALRDSRIKLGAQDVSEREGGAFTGDISTAMLKDLGCAAVIVGHSERRTFHGETDELVAQKFVVAQQAQLTPIVCVGETLEQRENGEMEAVIARQVDALLNIKGGTTALASAVLAYEPVWAIGTGKTATPQQAQDVHQFIRERIAARDGQLAENLRILYGGSVKPDNAKELFGMADIDGGLIGGASLKAEDFLSICEAAG